MADLASRKYVRYDSGVSHVPGSEAADIEVVKKAFSELIAADFARFGHSFPVSHARTLGIVKGKLIVSDDLPPHLKQSFLTKAGEYPVVLRYVTQNHMVTSPDNEAQLRGCALKIFNVPGERLPEGHEGMSQDFTFNSHIHEHDLSDAKTAKEIIMIRIKGIADPEGMNKIINARPDAALQNARLSATMPAVQCIPMYSQTPYRFGDYVGKHGLIPCSETQKSLESTTVPKDCKDTNIITKWLAGYFSQHEAVYEWKWQLCENMDEQSVEFAGSPWDVEKYPYQTVAKLVFPKQNTMDYDLKSFWEDHLATNSWTGLKTLEPLGSSNRVRRVVYPFARQIREKYNSRKALHPTKITDLPGPLPQGVPS